MNQRGNERVYVRIYVHELMVTLTSCDIPHAHLRMHTQHTHTQHTQHTLQAMDIQERFKVMVSEITEGFASGVKAGIIGEMGCSYPLTPHERVSLQAAALAQKETGKIHLPVTPEGSRLRVEVDVTCVVCACAGEHAVSH